MTKMYKIKVSGSYKVNRGDRHEIKDFDGIEGLIPECKDEEHRFMYVRGRFLPMWLVNQKASQDRDFIVREVYDIKEMDMAELQEFAADKDLRRVPKWRGSSLVEMRRKAYLEYATKILRQRYTKEEENAFNLSKMPPMVVDASKRAESEVKTSRTTN